MITKLMLLCIVLSLSFVADASIRVIGKGGGYGEMKALTALSKLRVYLTPCMLNRETCSMQAQDQKFLLEIDKLGFLNTEAAQLEFFTDPNSTDVFRYRESDRNYVAISSMALYTADGKPKSYPDIISTVFAAWLSRPGVRAKVLDLSSNWDGVFFSYDQLFRSVNVTENEVRLENDRYFREIRISLLGKEDVHLALEQAKNTLDLTSFVRQQLPCGSGAASVIDVYNSHAEGSVVVGRIRWGCGGSALYEARFHLQTDSAKKELTTKDLQLHVVNVVELRAPSSDCGEILGDKNKENKK